MKRSMILVGLMTLFLAVTISIGACGISTQDATSNLSNSVNSENGPGSGNWEPRKPANQRQARLLNETLVKMLDEIVVLGATHTQKILICYDEEGNRILDTGNELCEEPIKEIEIVLANYITDFRAGYGMYTTCCEDQDLPEIKLPETIGGRPFVIIDGLPGIQMPLGVEGRGDDQWWNANSSCCLTCVQNFENPEYAFLDLDLDESMFTSQ